MFKDELDKKVRELAELEPQPKVKQQPSREEINKIAMEDAEYLWERLKEIFLWYVKPGKTIRIRVEYNVNSNQRVYYRICDNICYGRYSRYHKLGLRKIKYNEETRRLVQQIAKKNGIIWWHGGRWYGFDEFMYDPPYRRK